MLALDQRRARLVEREPLRPVAAVRDLDRRAPGTESRSPSAVSMTAELSHAISRSSSSASERDACDSTCQSSSMPRRAVLLGSLRRVLELLERERERVRAQARARTCRRSAGARRRLVARVREIALARDLLSERLPVAPQALERRARSSRRCASLDVVAQRVGRDALLLQRVAVADRHRCRPADSPSTVMQNGVPTSSCRR